MTRQVGGRDKKERSFSFYLILSILVLLGGTIAGITALDYVAAEKMFLQQQQVQKEQTEESIRDALYLADAGLLLYDDTLNRHMEQGLSILMEEYNTSGGNPAAMDLAATRNRINDLLLTRAGPHLSSGRFDGRENSPLNLDLYVINASGIIEFTTYPQEKGFDFSTIPYFYQYLESIRNQTGFFPDRIVREDGGKRLRKYAYMPTPDHRYILELGLSGRVIEQERGRLEFQETIRKILSENPYVQNFAVYDSQLWDITDPDHVSFKPDTAPVATVLETHRDLTLFDQANRTTTTYLLVDLRSDRYGSDPSLVVRITYDRSQIDAALAKMLEERLIVAGFILLLGAIVAIGIGRFLAGPVGGIVDDVNRIASGDLDHPIARARGAEFSSLTWAISVMVGRLKEVIQQLSRSEKALALAEQRYRSISEIISDYAYGGIVDQNGMVRLEWGSGAFERITGYSYEEVEEQGWWQFLVYPQDGPVIREHLSRLFEHKSSASEFRIITKTGETRWISHRTVSQDVECRDGWVGFYATGQDITDRKVAEEAVIRMNQDLEERVKARTADLEQANRELEAFSYSVSHDLRAPLRAIDGFSRILSDQIRESKSEIGLDMIKKVRMSAQEMGRLIDGLLDFSRLGRTPLAISRVDTEEVVRKVLESVEPFMRTRSVEVIVGDLPPCDADQTLLTQVFYNLIENAVKYTREKENARITIGSEIRDGRVVYFVRDNGIGFDGKYARQIFGVFSRLHPGGAYEGTGVGLAIVKRIVERHGGYVSAEGVPGDGAAFFFTLGP